MDSTEDILSDYPALVHRIKEGQTLNTREIFLNILSIYGLVDAMDFVDIMVICKDHEINIIKGKDGVMKSEDNIQPIEIANLFVKLMVRRLGPKMQVFDDMLKQELTEFIYGLMMRYNVPPALEDAYEQKEDL